MNNKNIITILVLVALLVGGWFLFFQNSSTYNSEANKSNMQDNKASGSEYKDKKAEVQTNYGSFTIEFNENTEPKAVENFIRLAQADKYEGAPFHRILKGFMVQTGDYTKGDGTGGESAFGEPFAGDFDLNDPVYQKGYARGTVAMANLGCDVPKSNGSQFFIMHADLQLDTCYPIFGKVVAGMDVIDKIAEVPTAANDYGEPSVPTERIVIEKITISDK